LRTLVSLEVSRGLRWPGLSLSGVLNFFFRLWGMGIIVAVVNEIARQDSARSFEHRAQSLRLDCGNGDTVSRPTLFSLTQNRLQGIRVHQISLIKNDETRNLGQTKFTKNSFDCF
jgi:hypothetical protein